MPYPAASDSLALRGTATHGSQRQDSKLSHAWAPLLLHLVWAQCLWRQLWQQLVRTKGCSGKHSICSPSSLTLFLLTSHPYPCFAYILQFVLICAVIFLTVVLDMSEMSSAVCFHTENRQSLSSLLQHFPAIIKWLWNCSLKSLFYGCVLSLWPCLCTPPCYLQPMTPHMTVSESPTSNPDVIFPPTQMPFWLDSSIAGEGACQSLWLQYLYKEG